MEIANAIIEYMDVQLSCQRSYFDQVQDQLPLNPNYSYSILLHAHIGGIYIYKWKRSRLKSVCMISKFPEEKTLPVYLFLILQ